MDMAVRGGHVILSLTHRSKGCNRLPWRPPAFAGRVVARINPIRFRPKDAAPLSFDETFDRLSKAIAKFHGINIMGSEYNFSLMRNTPTPSSVPAAGLRDAGFVGAALRGSLKKVAAVGHHIYIRCLIWYSDNVTAARQHR